MSKKIPAGTVLTGPHSTGQAKSVRMSDVARLARVSAMTVSRALRAPDTVSEETRERIRDAIEKTGYIPNRLAGNLSSRHSDVIGLIVPSLRNSLFAETIQAIADNLGKAGFHVLIAESGHSLEVEEKLVLAFLSQQVSGIILHNTAYTPRIRGILTKADIPVIETGDLTRDPIDIVVSYSAGVTAASPSCRWQRKPMTACASAAAATWPRWRNWTSNRTGS